MSYINAHGTSTPINDREESRCMVNVWGSVEAVPPISSTKSMLGHSLGATGAVESVICLLAMRDQVLPPTINYTTPDPDCPLDYVPNQSRKAKVTMTMTNSAGFGGHNATLVFKTLQD
jgi:3-oxoacyl-[acyl-carrier-protein] synthase II